MPHSFFYGQFLLFSGAFLSPHKLCNVKKKSPPDTRQGLSFT
ncbi:hypothetical protein TREPR_1327 [Treponema primitia ZAS-2]|uniref:Uncharacterized protein n=1 Tax=Treponema primitia (strain ATCC BAA-887 / DSM 12427 / ZAS-2) TaxID=545694 RepID=F5YQV9_TREPZ|nr:hypothetical protein TREPR_1327 [Treponema primitia ZAS-2]